MTRPHVSTVRSLALLLAVAVGAAPLAACSGGARRPRSPGADGTGGEQATGQDGGAEVSLSDQDLAPIDAYIKRRQWVLGDDVEIVASKEYFIQNLSFATRIGFVKREDFEDKDQGGSTLTFLGSPAQLNEQSAPRVLIGTGITVTARHRITVRFVRTRTPDLPVRLRIAANGKASLGSGSQVLRREPSIVIGVQLRRAAGGGYQYEEQ